MTKPFYVIYANGRKVAKASRWKTVMRHVREQIALGNHGSVLQEYPNQLRADLFVMDY